jgi:hypothetical protein
MKNIKIKLEDMRDCGIPNKDFKVIALTNTVEFEIGDCIPLYDAKNLCDRPGTTVDIVRQKV